MFSHCIGFSTFFAVVACIAAADNKINKTHPFLEDTSYFWRKGRDSNSRSVISRTHDFQSCALDQLSHLCVCLFYAAFLPERIFFTVVFLTASLLYHTQRGKSSLF